jgi:putative ABC transport system permease protein
MRDWISALRTRLEPLRLPAAKEAAIVEELSQHLEDRCNELVAAGADETAAHATTLDELRHADLLEPRLAALHRPAAPEPSLTRRRSWGGGFLQDLRYAMRALLHQPAFSLVAIVTLALGIGLNTAMFSFLNALILRPLPFPDASAIARLHRVTPENRFGSFAAADYLALLQDGAGLGQIAAFRTANVTISDPGHSADWYNTTASFFDVVGLPPLLGRTFTAADELPGSRRVVVISYAFWQSRFAGASNVVGQTIRGNDDAYEIIGVLSAAAGDQRLLGNVGIFSPLEFTPADRTQRSVQNAAIIVRRASGVTAAQGEALVRAMGARMAAAFPRENDRISWRTEPLPQSSTGSTGRYIVAMLLGLATFVLLIGCSNLANLLLARAMERSRELAVRTALGASRSQLVRAIVLETALLAAAGGAGALAVSWWITGWLRSTIITSGGPAFDFSLDRRVAGFAVLVSLLTLFACALFPTLFAGRVRTSDSLRSGARGSTVSRRRHVRMRHALITAQFALAMTLLAGSGYFVRGAANLVNEHFGWTGDRVVQVEITLPDARYAKDEDITRFQDTIVERVQQLPGVDAASVSYGMPYTGLRGSARVSGQDTAGGANGTGSLGATVGSKLNAVSPQYFSVLQTRLLAGRPFDDRDGASTPRVVIVSESLARALFPTGSPIGRRVTMDDARQTWFEIVGVVQDVRALDVAEDVNPHQIYQVTAQDPRRHFTLAARTAGEPGGLAPSIRMAVVGLDPDLQTRRLMSANARMQDVTSVFAMVRRLLMAFAALGLFLAALGIYGAMTRMVAQRTGEIGLRMALGAQARNVVALVLGAGARIVGAGAALGVLGAIGLARLLGAVLPGLRLDGWTVGAAATMLLIAMALVACYRPARRATSIDPMTALRSE